MSFINEIASYVQKHAPKYGICVCSPIIAQAILESASGTSELAVNANNFFGLKYRANRCPSACGIYHKIGSEQNADGSYTESAMQWMKFSNMENGVIGYFDFINVSNYANLKGVTDSRTYLNNIKADGYATSHKYVENLMKVIEKYNLTQYDGISKGEEKKMVINVHAGHNPDGKIACGAIGFIKESTESRKVKNEVIRLLKALGHTVYDCTVEDGKSSGDVLNKIVSKCNAHKADLDVSIHLNSGAGDSVGNGKTTGTEVIIYSNTSSSKECAQNVCNAIATLGFKNRGVKVNSSLYVLRKTTAPAILIECCFVDDKDDVVRYDYKSMAEAIVYGITGQRYEEHGDDDADEEAAADGAETATGNANEIYRVQVGAYSKQQNAETMCARLRKAGFDAIIVKA